ncbi:VENN motif pre-toxin domain-containing protein [Terasakiella pusilla]|uniref:VENN motif pre-toxin domain-containing protein n=1 Tax=Terasakiella pusilla TaxID=64973 RepID=UPI003AA90552
MTAGGADHETTLEDTSKTVTTTTSTSSTSTKFSGPDIKQAALDTVANAVGEVGANKIGDLKADGLDTVTHKVLHAANGAVQGAIKSGGELDGAAVGEIVAEVVDDGTATRTNEKGGQVTKAASIAAQIAAGLAGKDTEIASGAATNAVENNYLLPKQLAQIDKVKEKCGNDPACNERLEKKAQLISHILDRDLVAAKLKAKAGSETDLQEIQTVLIEAADFDKTVDYVRELNPTWSEAQIQSQATAYHQEFINSLDASTTRVIIGALDAAGALTIGASGSVFKSTVASAAKRSSTIPTTKTIDNLVINKPRVGSANKIDPTHNFNKIIDNYVGHASKFSIPTKGPRGKVIRNSELSQIEGSLNGKKGVFEWIVDKGKVTHRRFIPNGKVTGMPNQVPKK